jgi:hypothetical protein
VLLDRAQRDHHAFRDRLVRPAFGHELEYLALARRQIFQWVVRAPPADQLRDDGRIERRPALTDATDGSGELLHVRHAVLEQIADTLGVLAEQLHRIGRLDVLREDEYAAVRPALPDLLGGTQSLVGLRRRHPDVDQGDVRLVQADVPEEILRRAALRHDLEPRVLQQARNALAQKDGVVGENYAHTAEPSPSRRELRKLPW